MMHNLIANVSPCARPEVSVTVRTFLPRIYIRYLPYIQSYMIYIARRYPVIRISNILQSFNPNSCIIPKVFLRSLTKLHELYDIKKKID